MSAAHTSQPKNRPGNKARPKTILQSLRLQAGLTVQQLAERAGCDASQVSYWERYEREPSRESRKAYALALGIPLGDLGRHIYEGSVKAGGGAA